MGVPKTIIVQWATAIIGFVLARSFFSSCLRGIQKHFKLVIGGSSHPATASPPLWETLLPPTEFRHVFVKRHQHTTGSRTNASLRVPPLPSRDAMGLAKQVRQQVVQHLERLDVVTKYQPDFLDLLLSSSDLEDLDELELDPLRHLSQVYLYNHIHANANYNHHRRPFSGDEEEEELSKVLTQLEPDAIVLGGMSQESIDLLWNSLSTTTRANKKKKTKKLPRRPIRWISSLLLGKRRRPRPRPRPRRIPQLEGFLLGQQQSKRKRTRLVRRIPSSHIQDFKVLGEVCLYSLQKPWLQRPKIIILTNWPNDDNDDQQTSCTDDTSGSASSVLNKEANNKTQRQIQLLEDFQQALWKHDANKEPDWKRRRSGFLGLLSWKQRRRHHQKDYYKTAILQACRLLQTCRDYKPSRVLVISSSSNNADNDALAYVLSTQFIGNVMDLETIILQHHDLLPKDEEAPPVGLPTDDEEQLLPPRIYITPDGKRIQFATQRRRTTTTSKRSSTTTSSSSDSVHHHHHHHKPIRINRKQTNSSSNNNNNNNNFSPVLSYSILRKL